MAEPIATSSMLQLSGNVLYMTLSYYFVMFYIYPLLKMQNTKVIGICYLYSVSIDIVYSTIHIGSFSNHVNNAYITSILPTSDLVILPA